ncbi:hypothetical protein [Flavobacterium sp. GT3R68]|uniref:hypothetical protein n=1 Tax=Flavobacterium sp. GT3R68 TaxID=2594437 RepID=UPI000F877624|nr:hypothetical protein [Flavobacterium sp. GT3R68]RTY94947.1 hypothetical protein EKL32_08485 [Flavobacterium sp. GSN2]TRW91751.1 hypothetical protein FNW07_07660 [Flavobacterium sp. GT3R68]
MKHFDIKKYDNMTFWSLSLRGMRQFEANPAILYNLFEIASSLAMTQKGFPLQTKFTELL